MTVDVAARAVELRAEGLTFTQIGEVLGIHRTRAYYWVTKNGQRAYTRRGAGFWERVAIGEPDECWEWQAGRNDARGGYGICTVEGRHTGAHRRAYELAKGPIPTGLLIRHTCDNPACCNPAHLLVGTIADNARDASERSRFRPIRGIAHPRCKFTDEQIARVHSLKSDGLSNLAIAAAVGMSPSYVCHVLKGRARA